jgi:hypothetical protein
MLHCPSRSVSTCLGHYLANTSCVPQHKKCTIILERIIIRYQGSEDNLPELSLSQVHLQECVNVSSWGQMPKLMSEPNTLSAHTERKNMMDILMAAH